jgi:hypothetical protein
MVDKKKLHCMIENFGPYPKKWPDSSKMLHQHMQDSYLSQDQELAVILSKEKKLDTVLGHVHVPAISASLAQQICQQIGAENSKQKAGNIVKFQEYQLDTWNKLKIWVKSRLRAYVLMSASLMVFISGGWVVGQHYQQTDLEVGDFYVDPALIMIVED